MQHITIQCGDKIADILLDDKYAMGFLKFRIVEKFDKYTGFFPYKNMKTIWIKL